MEQICSSLCLLIVMLQEKKTYHYMIAMDKL